MGQTERYLIYGASGVQGGAVARRLVAQGGYVRTLTRNEETVVSLKEHGIDAVIGGLGEPRTLAGSARKTRRPIKYWVRDAVAAWHFAKAD